MTINLGNLVGGFFVLVVLGWLIYEVANMYDSDRAEVMPYLIGLGFITLAFILMDVATLFEITPNGIQQIEPTIECVCNCAKCICNQ